MKNRIIIRALALFSALTLCVCCLVSCDFNNPLRETYEEPKQIVGVENLTEEEIQTANMINEKVKKFYAVCAESGYGISPDDKYDRFNNYIDAFSKDEKFAEFSRETIYIVLGAAVDANSKDLFKIFKFKIDEANFRIEDYEEVSCVSIVATSDTAEVIVKVLFNDKTIKYHKAELVLLNEEWFVASVPVTVNYTPAS